MMVGLELEVDTYSGIIQEMSNTAAQLIQAAHPDSKLIRQRDELLNRELKALKKETKDRRDKLVLSIQVLPV
jgi:spectrin beta